jgi:hypothetical protein
VSVNPEYVADVRPNTAQVQPNFSAQTEIEESDKTEIFMADGRYMLVRGNVQEIKRLLMG